LDLDNDEEEEVIGNSPSRFNPTGQYTRGLRKSYDQFTGYNMGSRLRSVSPRRSYGYNDGIPQGGLI